MSSPPATPCILRSQAGQRHPAAAHRGHGGLLDGGHRRLRLAAHAGCHRLADQLQARCPALGPDPPRDTESHVGTFVATLISLSAIVVAASFHVADPSLMTTRSASQSLAFLGSAGPLLFALGILGSGMVALPLLAASLSFSISEALGWESGLNKEVWEARYFYIVDLQHSDPLGRHLPVRSQHRPASLLVAGRGRSPGGSHPWLPPAARAQPQCGSLCQPSSRRLLPLLRIRRHAHRQRLLRLDRMDRAPSLKPASEAFAKWDAVQETNSPAHCFPVLCPVVDRPVRSVIASDVRIYPRRSWHRQFGEGFLIAPRPRRFPLVRTQLLNKEQSYASGFDAAVAG